MDTQIEQADKKLSKRFPGDVPNEVIEDQTKKIPNLLFMGLAGAAILGSVALAARSKQKTDFANFVGQWAPTFLLLGIYNKIVKVETEVLRQRGSKTNLH